MKKLIFSCVALLVFGLAHAQYQPNCQANGGKTYCTLYYVSPGVPLRVTDYLAIYGQCKDYSSSPNPNPHYTGAQRQWAVQLYWTVGP